MEKVVVEEAVEAAGEGAAPKRGLAGAGAPKREAVAAGAAEAPKRLVGAAGAVVAGVAPKREGAVDAGTAGAAVEGALSPIGRAHV